MVRSDAPTTFETSVMVSGLLIAAFTQASNRLSADCDPKMDLDSILRVSTEGLDGQVALDPFEQFMRSYT